MHLIRTCRCVCIHVASLQRCASQLFAERIRSELPCQICFDHHLTHTSGRFDYANYANSTLSTTTLLS